MRGVGCGTESDVEMEGHNGALWAAIPAQVVHRGACLKGGVVRSAEGPQLLYQVKRAKTPCMAEELAEGAFVVECFPRALCVDPL